MTLTHPSIASPADMQYLSEVLLAIASGQSLPKGIKMPSHVNPSDLSDDLDGLCLGALAMQMHINPAKRYSWADISQVLTISLTTIQYRLHQLDFLHGWHLLNRQIQLRKKYLDNQIAHYEDMGRRLKIQITTKEVIMQLKEGFAKLNQENGYYDLLTTDVNTLSLSRTDQRRLLLMKRFVDGTYSSYRQPVEDFGVSTETIRRILVKELRRWRHPSRYGNFMVMHIDGGVGRPTSTLDLVNPDQLNAQGDPEWSVVEELTFKQMAQLVNERLKSLGQSLKIQVTVQTGNEPQRLTRIDLPDWFGIDVNKTAVYLTMEQAVKGVSFEDLHQLTGMKKERMVALQADLVDTLLPYAERLKLPRIIPTFHYEMKRKYNTNGSYALVGRKGKLLQGGNRVSSLFTRWVKEIVDLGIDPVKVLKQQYEQVPSP